MKPHDAPTLTIDGSTPCCWWIFEHAPWPGGAPHGYRLSRIYARETEPKRFIACRRLESGARPVTCLIKNAETESVRRTA